MSYENLVAAFEDAGIEADCGFVEKNQNPCACFIPGERGRETFKCIIHCKNWKWKSSTNTDRETKRVSILIQVEETIRRRDQALLSSVVHVDYLSVNNGQASLLQAFHYDYDPCQRDHAFFHAQVTDECCEVSEVEKDALKIDFALPARLEAPRHRGARIPTCDMTMPSVLVCLAADHIGGKVFRTFREKVCELQQNMPLPLIGKLRRSLGAESSDLRSSHWFAHCLGQSQ